MNKRGFTLAEVLITLGIIGVIAALTVPTLMNNSTEMEFRSAFKKGLAALNQAVTMNVAIDNVDFDSLTSSDIEHTDYDSLYAMLVNRMSTAKFLGPTDNSLDAQLLNIGEAAGVGQGEHADGSRTTGLAGNVAMFFTDGSCIVWDPIEAANPDRNGIRALWDVNGSKKPNRLTWCDTSGPNGKPNKTFKSTADDQSVCTDDSVVVRDQFSILLKGNRAVPNGRAAHFLFYMK